MKTLMSKFKALLFFLFIILLLIHFVFKDRFHSIGIFFYAFPLHLILIYGIFVSLFHYRQKRSFYVLTSLVFILCIYFSVNYFGGSISKAKSTPSIYVLFWNVAQKKKLPTDILIQHIKESTPEVIALVEALNVSKEDLNKLKNACPEYNFQALRGDMLIGSKGTVTDIIFKSDVDAYRYNYMVVRTAQKEISVLIVDVYVYPIWNREEALKTLYKVAQNHNVDIVLGDFNTPFESVFFSDFNTTFNSFHDYSIGLTSTWPTPIPLIEIDQIWIAKSFQPIKLKKFRYQVSNHKLLVAEFE